MQRIYRSIRAGHPVCWEGDISDSGFSFSRGTATLHSEKPCAGRNANTSSTPDAPLTTTA